MNNWVAEKKAHLTPREALIVAYAHLICGVDQQVLATIYNTNSGRVSEACTVIREACDKHMEIYRDRAKGGKVD